STTINLNLQYDSLKTQLMTLYTLSTTSGSFSGTYEEWLETVRGPQGNQGEPGQKIELRIHDGNIQWKYENDTNWGNLIALSQLTGPQGPQGEQGEQGPQG